MDFCLSMFFYTKPVGANFIIEGKITHFLHCKKYLANKPGRTG
jgi:hypothetical protein